MKVAVLSFAHPHAAGYLRGLLALPGVEVFAADPDQDLARSGEVRGAEFARDFPGATYLDSYEEAFARGLDAVVICSENVRHRPLVEMAAAHGVDALCEKPLATSVADGEAMVAACREAGVRLKVAYPVRFSPAYAGVRRALMGGASGKVLTVLGANNGSLPDGRAWFADPELAGGGALMDHTVHIADLLDELLDGDPAVRVYAQVNNLLYAETVEVETAGLVSVEYAGGTVATIDCSWSHPQSHPSWGGLEMQVVAEGAHVDMNAFDQRIGGFSQARGTLIERDFGTSMDARLISTFLHGAEPGGVEVADAAESGLRTLRIVEAAYESARTGAVVDLS